MSSSIEPCTTMRMRSRRLLIGCILFALSMQSGRADTVILRNGQTLEGTITGQTGTTVTIRTENGVQTIPRPQVQRITFGQVKKPEEKKAEKPKAEVRKKPAEDPRDKAEREKAAREREEMLTGLLKAQISLEESIGEIRSVRREDVRYERNQALWRSAIMPGWGQFHLDHYGRAVLLFGSAAGLYSAWSADAVELKRLETLYNSATTPLFFRLYFGNESIPATYLFFNQIKKQVRVREQRLEATGAMAGTVWALSMLDVWFNHGEKFQLSLKVSPFDLYAPTFAHSTAGRIDFGLHFKH